MPTGSGAAEQLRHRAASLRTAAAKIEACSAIDLYHRAGGDVWRGPTPTRCLDDLLQMRAGLCRGADELRAAARTLEQRAEQLDAQARAQTALGTIPGTGNG